LTVGGAGRGHPDPNPQVVPVGVDPPPDKFVRLSTIAESRFGRALASGGLIGMREVVQAKVEERQQRVTSESGQGWVHPQEPGRLVVDDRDDQHGRRCAGEDRLELSLLRAERGLYPPGQRDIAPQSVLGRTGQTDPVSEGS